MAKTNKQLLKAGLSQEEILELVEMYLTKEYNGVDFESIVHEVEMGGYDENIHVFCKDGFDRSYDISMEMGNKEAEHIIFFSTSKVGDEECSEMNVKQFSSITAVMNQIARMNKSAL